MKRIVPEFTFSDEQLDRVKAVAAACNVRELTAKILFARGADTPEKAERFLSPSKKHFLSPFLMRGMRELVDAIGRVKEKGGLIAVFGDYDADGICAASILTSALKAAGANCFAYIPEREEGYGMRRESLEKIISERTPDLFVTVDCGVSNREEVAFIRSRGIPVIVTDHHELPPSLPDCTIVNPKIEDDYPYDNLCGAGVAFKIACALLGEKAYSLLDLAAIATVADSVPLTGENRDIVAEGLRLINRKPRLAVKYLFGGKSGDVTAQSLAFTVAPRINAAGRMGDANCALRLFTSEDSAEIYDLASRLNAFNIERQQVCDEVYKSAKRRLEEGGAYESAILLADESWSTGLVGIVAAKLAEEFNRPCILFVKNGDILKGSARTNENVNIYEALKACSGLLAEFGGHAQAAGVKVTEENFSAFRQAFCRYIDEHYSAEDFIPSIGVAAEADFVFDTALAREIERLEPFGVGNKKPLFSLAAGALPARRLRDGSPHISVGAKQLELIWFGGERALPLIEADLKKTFVFECGVSSFRGESHARGIVKDMICAPHGAENARLYLFRNELLRLKSAPAEVSPEYLSAKDLREEILRRRSACRYGLLLIASEKVPEEFKEAAAGLDADIFRLSTSNAGNAVLISPAADAALDYYRCVAYLDEPADFNVAALTGKRVLVNGERCGYGSLAALDVSRSTMGEIYRALRSGPTGENSIALALSSDSGFSPEQVIFAAEVFAELGLIRFGGGKMSVVKNRKSDLALSAIYRSVCALKER